MQTPEHVLEDIRGQCSIQRSRDFPSLFEAITRGYMQSSDPLIKQSCCNQLTTAAGQTLRGVLKVTNRKVRVQHSILEKSVDSNLYAITPISKT